MTPAGSIAYFTYIGGAQSDQAYAIAIDPAGNAYVGGTTYSADFPVTPNAFQTKFGGDSDGFLAVVNPSGSNLDYSSFLGGAGQESVKGIVVDAAGAVYAAGITSSRNFPTTPGAFKTTKPDASYTQNYNVGFAAKFIGATPAWKASYSTYLGGDWMDGLIVNGLAVNAAGQAIVTGTVYQRWFPLTPDALKPAPSGDLTANDSDLFLTKFSEAGDLLVYSTRLGGTGSEFGGYVALDSSGAAYVTGNSWSADYPATPGAYQTANPPGSTSPYPIVLSKIDLTSSVACVPQLRPYSMIAPASGATLTVQMTMPVGCPWEVYPMTGGIKVSGAQTGMGTGAAVDLTLIVDPNDSTIYPRTLHVGINVALITVDQPARSCSEPVFSPASLSFDSAGGSQTVSVSMPTECSWTAMPNAPWISVTGPGSSGSVTRTITIKAPPNAFGTRSGAIAIASRSLPVTQTGGTCTGTAAASPSTFTASGGSGSVQITTTSTCAWNAFSTVSWIQVNYASSSGRGSGAAAFSVAQNPGSVARTGGLLIGDKTVSITQSAGPSGNPLSYSATLYAGAADAISRGDGGPATSARLQLSYGLAVPGSTLYLADADTDNRIRAVTSDGVINTVAGGGNVDGEGIVPTTAFLSNSFAVTFDSARGILYFGDGYRVRRVSGASNVLTTVAGAYNPGTPADDQAALSPQFFMITGLAVDSAGSLYVADSGNSRVRKVTGGTITTVAGGGSSFADGGSPTATSVKPGGIALDSAGALYIWDCQNLRIRKVVNGVITSIAGGGSGTGDGVPATSVSLACSAIAAITVDPAGAVYFSDGSRVRKVGADGLIHTIGPLSQTSTVRGLAADSAGNVFASYDFSHIWRLTPDPTFCAYSASTVPVQPAAGGAFSISVTTGTGCGWQASLSASAPWVTLSGTQGSGNGTVSVTLAPNTGVGRTTIFIVGGQAVTITQAGVPRIGSDFNGDGAPDLVWQNEATRQVTVNYYGGAGGASYQGYNWLYTSAAPGWRVVAVADFNSDGAPDLVWQNEATGQASVHYYGGSGGAVDGGWSWLYTGNAAGWKIVAAADFNGDGVPDLVWQNEATRQVVVHYYGGSGGALDQGWAWLYGASAPGWRVVAAADFNADGIPDLVWQGEATRQVSVHYYGGSGGAVDQGWNWLNTAGAPGWKVAAASDFNGDGVPDLVWMNDTTRQVTVHYYGGTGGAVYQGWNWLNSSGAPGWTIAP